MTPRRVLLADDHALVRAGLRALLEKLPGVEVCGEAGDGGEALALVRSRRPDILLMDISMKGMGGIEATAAITREFPAVRVIILSMHKQEEYVLQALRAGAAGYLLKDSATGELELALSAVGDGGTWLSPAVSRAAVDGWTGRAPREGEREPLTPRQREILRLIAQGRSTKEIAHALSLSAKTVESHRAQLMERLAIRDVAGLVMHAIRLGLISPAD